MDFDRLYDYLQLAALVFAILVSSGTIKGRAKEEAATLTEMKVDIKYIKNGVSCIPTLEHRVTVVEESAKQAHKRLDQYIMNEKREEN